MGTAALVSLSESTSGVVGARAGCEGVLAFRREASRTGVLKLGGRVGSARGVPKVSLLLFACLSAGDISVTANDLPRQEEQD
jgi:hypothetical protein